MQSLRTKRWLFVLASLVIVALSLESFSSGKFKKKKQHDDKNAVLWRDPGNIRKRDLYYGPGSKELAPVPPFHFVKEVKEGTLPKFDVEDARGVKWRVKLGPEAQSETVATRLVWAAGYNAEESYYFDHARIDGMQKLSRGQKYVEGDSVRGARFKPHRKNVERGEQWDWNKNPFKNTRELNGLKTMIVLLNDWDVLKQNNKVIHVKDPSGKVESRYTVADLDTTLGAVGGFGRHRSENNVQDFERRRMVSKVDKGRVKFNYDLKPKKFGLVSLVYPPYFLRQRRNTNAMQKVPVEHAAWIGSILGQLSDNQLRDSFRAAGYDRATTERYVRTMRSRINELNRLNQPQVAVRSRRVR
ncbi:MAG: hypothetical protein DMF72_00670 [Acidobacteria bacterium]|nr:MAG: hypothetical protein DMF72_00670 [Acidobacteriota bacterium]